MLPLSSTEQIEMDDDRSVVAWFYRNLKLPSFGSNTEFADGRIRWETGERKSPG
jgi:hypothetical protein